MVKVLVSCTGPQLSWLSLPSSSLSQLSSHNTAPDLNTASTAQAPSVGSFQQERGKEEGSLWNSKSVLQELNASIRQVGAFSREPELTTGKLGGNVNSSIPRTRTQEKLGRVYCGRKSFTPTELDCHNVV